MISFIDMFQKYVLELSIFFYRNCCNKDVKCSVIDEKIALYTKYKHPIVIFEICIWSIYFI